MEDEIASFKRFEFYEEVSSDMVSAKANILSTRWVISKKMNDDGKWQSKARLVARGYQDKEKDRVSLDSPVDSSAAQSLILALLAEKQRIPIPWDFTTAFLQGKSLTRDVFVVPPIDFVGSHVVWRLKKPIYGIVSAPKSWFDRLIEVCRASGSTTATTDEGLLIMTSGEQVVGVLALHVDDEIGCGTFFFHGVMAKIGKTLAVGSHETSNFRYKGLRVSTVFKEEQTVFEINVDGNDDLASCRTMDVPLGEDTDLLPPQSKTDYSSVVGTIGYASSEFRPDVAWESSSLSRHFVTPTILDAKRANAALQYARKNRVILKYRRGVENLTMFHDGSLGNLDDGKSQGGRIACLQNKTGHSVASWIFWESRTIKRVCCSSSASEVLSAVEGYDATTCLLALWKEISGQDFDALLVTDRESLQQKAVSTALPTEKWLRIDTALLRQGLRCEEYGLVWAGSSSNLANPLTKGPRGISPTISVKLPLLRALETNCTHLDTVPTRIKTWADVSKY
jgi:Reverse transcriptase (RNA-dependent DNA polymerase)